MNIQSIINQINLDKIDPFDFVILKNRAEIIELFEYFNKSVKMEWLNLPGRALGAKKLNKEYLASLKQNDNISRKFLIGKHALQNSAFVKELLANRQRIKILKNELRGFRMSIKDRKEVVIICADPKSHKRIGIYSANKNFSISLGIIYDLLWENSEDFGK